MGKWARRLALSVSLSAFAACGGTTGPGPDPLPDDQGTFNAVISGDGIGAAVSGHGMFGVATNSSGVQEWTVFLYSGTTLLPNYRFNVVTLIRHSLSPPAAGTWPIYDFATGAPTDDDFVGAYVFSYSTSYGVFPTVSGSLTVDIATDAEIVGSFELIGVRDPALSELVNADTAVVSGTFRAVPGNIPLTF